VVLRGHRASAGDRGRVEGYAAVFTSVTEVTSAEDPWLVFAHKVFFFYIFLFYSQVRGAHQEAVGGTVYSGRCAAADDHGSAEGHAAVFVLLSR